MIELVIDQRQRNIGSLEVGCLVPFAKIGRCQRIQRLALRRCQPVGEPDGRILRPTAQRRLRAAGKEVHSRLVSRVNAHVHSLSNALAASRKETGRGRALTLAREVRRYSFNHYRQT